MEQHSNFATSMVRSIGCQNGKASNSRRDIEHALIDESNKNLEIKQRKTTLNNFQICISPFTEHCTHKQREHDNSRPENMREHCIREQKRTIEWNNNTNRLWLQEGPDPDYRKKKRFTRFYLITLEEG
jgi:hypothetical protein